MKAYCENCDSVVECVSVETIDEVMTIKGVEFHAPQQYGRCPACGAQVVPTDLMDYNTMHAHDAYRKAIGAITTMEIRAIMEKYDIGSQPLSILLGWGPNTIDRHLCHTIPDREHSKALKNLENPLKMKIAFEQRGSFLTPIARKKLSAALDSLIYSESWTPVHKTRHDQNFHFSFAGGIND